MADFEKAKMEAQVPTDFPPEDEWKAFTTEDPYNPGMKLEGFLCRSSTRYYGALLITRVNNDWQPTLIFCTPKLHYPFDDHDNWHFPKARKIEVYEKLDGTNIFAYVYQHGGAIYQTFKTRQTPVVQDTDLVPFKSLLLEVFDRKQTRQYWMETNRNLSFELYGAKNPHLIMYNNPISLAFLFSVDPAGNIYAPSSHPWLGETARMFDDVAGNYVETYKWHQQEDEKNLQLLDDGGYQGTEGRVWYMLTEGMRWVMFKCKPESIEKIHWATGGIGANIIKATAINAMESGPLDVESVIKLLAEEFTEQQIEKSRIRIGHAIEEIKFDLAFREKVLKLYDGNGISITENKAGAMRLMSTHFTKGEMKRVYSTIVAHRGDF